MASERKSPTRYRVLKEIVIEAIPDPAYAPMIEECERKRQRAAGSKKDQPSRPRSPRKKPRKKSDD